MADGLLPLGGKSGFNSRVIFECFHSYHLNLLNLVLWGVKLNLKVVLERLSQPYSHRMKLFDMSQRLLHDPHANLRGDDDILLLKISPDSILIGYYGDIDIV